MTDMSTDKSHKLALPIGAACTAIGLYFVLVGLAVLPVPGGERNLHAPLWVVAAAGSTFLLGGLALILQIVGGANAQGELPKGAPGWIKTTQVLFVLGIFVAFAATTTWVAFGPGERQFSGNVPLAGRANEIVGRVVFGIGAIAMWLGVLIVFGAARKQLFGSGKD
jgi:hypothetical protein